jgi:hypothetical protein
MQRQQLQFLQKWLHSKNRKPLIIRGARQVGKSTFVELFAKPHQQNLFNVNLERYPELSQVFSSKYPEQILQQIEALPRMVQISHDMLLFLDKIQAVPEAILSTIVFQIRNLQGSNVQTVAINHPTKQRFSLQSINHLSNAVVRH